MQQRTSRPVQRHYSIPTSRYNHPSQVSHTRQRVRTCSAHLLDDDKSKTIRYCACYCENDTDVLVLHSLMQDSWSFDGVMGYSTKYKARMKSLDYEQGAWMYIEVMVNAWVHKTVAVFERVLCLYGLTTPVSRHSIMVFSDSGRVREASRQSYK